MEKKPRNEDQPHINGEQSEFSQEVDNISALFKSLSDVRPEGKESEEIPALLESTDDRDIVRWAAKNLGLEEDQIILEKGRATTAVFIDGESEDVSYNFARVAIRSKTNGMTQQVFIHEPRWVRNIRSLDRQFSSQQNIDQQHPQTDRADVENTMIERRLIGQEEAELEEKVQELVKKIDGQPFLFGTVDELRSFLVANFGDMAKLISINVGKSGGGNLDQGAGTSINLSFSGETGDISPALFSVSASNQSEAIHPDGSEAVFKIDLRELRGNLLRKGLEIKGETVLEGSFEEVKAQLKEMGVLEAAYTKTTKTFIEEGEDGLEIGYFGGFGGDKREVAHTFPKVDDRYVVDWSVFVKRKRS